MLTLNHVRLIRNIWICREFQQRVLNYSFSQTAIFPESISPLQKEGTRLRSMLNKKNPCTPLKRKTYWITLITLFILKIQNIRKCNKAKATSFFVVRLVKRIISDRPVGKIIIIPSFSVGLSENKNIDNGVKETSAIISTQVTYEIDHISLFQDSTKPSALMLGFNHGDDIHHLEWRNLVTPDSPPKVCCHSIPTTCAHLGLNSSSTERLY